MKCEKVYEDPETGITNTWPCGQCKACRITRRQEWTFRLILEAREHPYIYFVTLTYDDAHLPEGGTLVKEELKLFLKRLRYYLGHEIRYYAVGEYGEDKLRPHYHLILYSDTYIEVDYEKRKGRKGERIAWFSHRINSAWTDKNNCSIGLTECEPLLDAGDAEQAIAYTAGYILKKLNNEKGINWLKEKSKIDAPLAPEFATMSRRPHGIGLNPSTIKEILKDMVEDDDRKMFMARYKGKLYPLSRTLRDKMVYEAAKHRHGEIIKGDSLKVVGNEQFRRSLGPQKFKLAVLQTAERQQRAKKKIETFKKGRKRSGL